MTTPMPPPCGTGAKWEERTFGRATAWLGEPGPQQHDRCVAKKECGQSRRSEHDEAPHGLRDHQVPGGVLAISVLTRWADKIA